MLPSGPRSTYPISSGIQPGARDLARQILATIAAQNARANEVRTGLMTTGCDGQPVINPLDGTTCGGDGTKVLYNPQTMTVLGTFSKPAAAGPKTVTVRPALCSAVIAKLKARRRFTDNLGNVYGPTGLWLGYGDPPAVLETDYVHQLVTGRTLHYGDPITWRTSLRLSLKKTIGVLAALPLMTTMQGGTWPSINDVSSMPIVTDPYGTLDIYHVQHLPVLNDVVFGGLYSATDGRVFAVGIDGTAPDTFKWFTGIAVIGADSSIPLIASGVAITPGVPQTLSYGVTVTFGAATGHAMNDLWLGGAYPNDTMIRAGVAIRGTLDTATPCLSPNSNVLLTTECNQSGLLGATGSHALVVRDPDTLALLYRKPLTYDATGYAWGDPPQKFSFSTNDEGLFFMHCYTMPSLASPPTPYPGAEFGSPNSRKVAVISVNPMTFEPTITELITLEDAAGYTSTGTFAVAKTV